MDVPPLPRTLILDYYDSYTNNLLTLFTKLYSDAEVLEKVVVVKADHFTWPELQRSALPNIDCIILSPGPGRSDNPADIGFALDLIRLHPLPILGVCLGHQAIATAFGGKIINTPRITHGHVIPVRPVQPGVGLFASDVWKRAEASEGSGAFDVVVYNSLTVDPKCLPEELEITAWTSPSELSPATIQGLQHRSYPIWGVQYHPESISSTRGTALLQSYLDGVHRYHNSPSRFPDLTYALKTACSYRVASSSKQPGPQSESVQDELPWPTPPMTPSTSHDSVVDTAASRKSTSLKLLEKRFGDSGRELKSEDVFQALFRVSRKGKERADGAVWLDGQTRTRTTTSSMAVPAFALTYSLASRTVKLYRRAVESREFKFQGDETFWEWFSQGQAELQSRLVSARNHDTGWQGGWVGWFGYEMKEESLPGYRRRPRRVGHPTDEVDACWAWCDEVLERSQDGEWIARSIFHGPGEASLEPSTSPPSGSSSMLRWLGRLDIRLGRSASDFDRFVLSVSKALALRSASQAPSSIPAFRPLATDLEYQEHIDDCREAIRRGESYELTMTTAFTSTLPPSTDPFALYLHLRSFNPAYYSTYMAFPDIPTPRGQGIHILSSSPERFLKIEQKDEARRVEMMPIKGTRARVKPGACVCGPGRGCEGVAKGGQACVDEAKAVDRQRGEELQTDTKERAENLMIVDLIRSDLLSCCTPSTVTVPRLIALESYGVHNLVTTVRGVLADNVSSVEAVKRCFPPGSMTGAPKLRSVQLLDQFEGGRKRGVYSGALGYIGIDGTTDLSVVIRTIVIEGYHMSVGAGGAITWLSDRKEEWEEVLTKVRSVVGDLAGL